MARKPDHYAVAHFMDELWRALDDVDATMPELNARRSAAQEALMRITGVTPVRPLLLEPDGWQLVPKEIHPLDAPVACQALINQLAHAPRTTSDDENDFYATWWSMLLDAAPKFGAR